jgi:hypothetical protein
MQVITLLKDTLTSQQMKNKISRGELRIQIAQIAQSDNDF